MSKRPPIKKPAKASPQKAKSAPSRQASPSAKSRPAAKPKPAKTAPSKAKTAAKTIAKPAAKPKPGSKKAAPPKKSAPAAAPAKKKAAVSPKAAPPKPAKAPAPKKAPAGAPAKKTAPAEKKAPAKAAPPPAKGAKAEKPAQTPAVPKAAKPAPAPAAASGALYYDSHMHTPLCKHAWGEPEEYAEQGLRAGLKGIVFTCHCPMPDGFWPTVRMADSEFGTYLELVARAAKAYEGRLDVRLGLESEFYPGMEPWIEKLHQRADFDYILGGVHWQARDYLAKYETGTIEAFRKCYFNHLADSAETGLYDCLAHPDLVKNYHPDSWCFAILKDNIASALDRIAKTGVAMELNTSGLIKSYSEMNPGLEMLRMMADRQIPIVIGSDAHRPHRVGEHFMTALSHLQEAGYDQVSHFIKRQRVDLKISAVQASIKKAADAQAG